MTPDVWTKAGADASTVGREEEGRNRDTANRDRLPSPSRAWPAVGQSRASPKAAAAAVEKQTAVEHRPQYCRSSRCRNRNSQLCRRRILGEG